MPTAVLVSGLPREVRECWRSLQSNLLVNLRNPDVFIHSGQSYPVGPEFFTTLKPKKYVIEDQFRHHEMEAILNRIGYYDVNHLPKCVQQLYGLKRVWEVMREYERETRIVYDVIVRVRPDLLFLKPVTMEMLELNRINTLHDADGFLMSSEFAIGPSEQMVHYFGIWDWLLNNEALLTKDHPRLQCTPDGLYHNDILFTTCLQDYHKLRFGQPKFLPESAYHYYRVMNRHRNNEYTEDPELFFHTGGPCTNPPPGW